jgi:hypothetical protein
MKKLKILLGNNTLSFLGGSETWTETLALQLKEMGHDVSCYSPSLGLISNNLQTKGIKCYSEISNEESVSPFSIVLEEKVSHEYDVIIANHNHIVSYLRSKFPKTPIISTIHGIIHLDDNGNKAPEHPELESGVNQFVAVSEEVQHLLKEKYNIEAPIVRNFFDLKKFNSDRTFSEKPKQILVNTNYMDQNDPAIVAIRDVAKHYDARLVAVGLNFSQLKDISNILSTTDIVFGMGRSVLEGVASGALGIVHGRWGTAGVINQNTVEGVRWFNFSGRNSNGIATSEELIKMIDAHYNQSTINWGKDYMKFEHNVIKAAEEYVRMARELTGEILLSPTEEVDTRRPYKRAE